MDRGSSPLNQSGQTVGTQINVGGSSPAVSPVYPAIHQDLIRPPAAGAIEIRATGFCDVCRPEYFPDVRLGSIHISGRHPEWGPRLYCLEPVELSDGRKIDKIFELALMGTGYAMIIKAALNDQGRVQPCRCGKQGYGAMCELIVADWARVSFSGMRRGG